jgi:glycosyltransferase involved in cell wall biosynthesis
MVGYSDNNKDYKKCTKERRGLLMKDDFEIKIENKELVDLSKMKVAIVHDWLTNYGGAERVVETFLEIFPQANIYTTVYDEKNMGHIFPKGKVKTSFLQKIPMATKLYTKMLPMMPKAFESFDLNGYDLILSSSSSCAKGIITSHNSTHISYVHTPMRYAWDLYHDYYNGSGFITKASMNIFMPSIRKWDVLNTFRIDHLVANSNYVAKRINKYYKRDAEVIHPPVNTDFFSPNGKESEDFYVVFSRFVPYKRIDLAIKACTDMRKRLVVIGDGEQRDYLKSIAGKTIEFTGRIPDEEVRDYLQRCKAMIFSAEEDFGIVPVEAQACGRPVIAYGKGGALETVKSGVTGVHFNNQTVPSLKKAIVDFEKIEFNQKDILNHAKYFSKDRFKEEIKNQVMKSMRYK